MAVVEQGRRPDDRFFLVANSIARSTLPPRAKSVYLFMRSHESGWELNARRIADAIGMSRNTVAEGLNDLITAGWVLRVDGQIAPGKTGTVKYVVLAEPSEAVEVKQEIADQKSKAEDSFTEFWRHYPRKTNKAQAKRSYEKQLTLTDAETLQQAVEHFADEMDGTDKKYIPHCSTWLNQERWRDFLTTVEETTGSNDLMADDDFFARW